MKNRNDYIYNRRTVRNYLFKKYEVYEIYKALYPVQMWQLPNMLDYVQTMARFFVILTHSEFFFQKNVLARNHIEVFYVALGSSFAGTCLHT